MKLLYAGFALAVLAGCKEEVIVSVDCKPSANHSVECELKETKGKSEVEVCWDWNAKCENGAIVSAARTCQKVKDGGTATATISADKLTGVDKCTGVPVSKVENLTLNGKPSK